MKTDNRTNNIYLESGTQIKNTLLMLALICGLVLFTFDTSQAPKNLTREAYFINHVIVSFLFMIVTLTLLCRQRPGYYKLCVPEEMMTIKKGIVSKHIMKNSILIVTTYPKTRLSAGGVLIYYDKIKLKYFLVPDRFDISKESIAQKINEKFSISVDDLLNKQKI